MTFWMVAAIERYLCTLTRGRSAMSAGSGGSSANVLGSEYPKRYPVSGLMTAGARGEEGSSKVGSSEDTARSRRMRPVGRHRLRISSSVAAALADMIVHAPKKGITPGTPGSSTGAEASCPGGPHCEARLSDASRSKRKLRRCEQKNLSCPKSRISYAGTRFQVLLRRSMSADCRPCTSCVTVWKLLTR